MKYLRRNNFVLATIVSVATLSLSGCDGDDGGSDVNPAVAEDLLDSAQARCLVEDPRRAIGDDVPSSKTASSVGVGLPPVCADNKTFHVGAAIFDITNTITDGSGAGFVNPQQMLSGLHTRMHARALAIESPCNGKRVMYVLVDIIAINEEVQKAVFAEIAADPELSRRWNASNVMLAATHTHSHAAFGRNAGPVITHGIYQAIRNADKNQRANPQVGSLMLNSGELLNTNANRSVEAYLLNPEVERQQYLDINGNEVRTNREMVQLELYRANKPVGLINWFGVHATTVGTANSLTSSDNKGIASLGFERLMGTDYYASAEEGTFVAAFAQAEEGDSSPNIFLDHYRPPNPARGGGETDWDSLDIAGTKHVARAIELYGAGAPVVGPVDYQFAFVPINNISITDPVVLESMNLPAELDSDDKRTCDGAWGASFGAGAPEDAPGPGQEGVSCADSPDVLQAALDDVGAIENLNLATFPGAWPHGVIPSHVASALTLCNVRHLPGLAADFSCQAEKPVTMPNLFTEAPIQLLRFGQLAVLGLPFEVTTMSGRRIRKHLLEVLAPVGVTKVVVGSQSNSSVGYLTTREEYAAQHYEGASTMFGPWTLAAVMQESLKLARKMRDSAHSPEPAVAAERIGSELEPGPVELPSPWGVPGDILSQPPAEVEPGEVISVEIVAGHPDNDLRIQQSYVYVEKQATSGDWISVVEDRDPSLVYVWKPDARPPGNTDLIGPSPGLDSLGGPDIASGGRAEAVWSTPRNVESGTYRFRIVGASRSSPDTTTPYEAVSDTFLIMSADGSSAVCP